MAIALAQISKIMHNGENRVSLDAVKTLAEDTEEYATQVAKRADILAKHAGRKTIKKEDIKLAEESLFT